MTTKIRSRLDDSMSTAYVLGLLTVTGIFALASAILILAGKSRGERIRRRAGGLKRFSRPQEWLQR